MIKVCVREDGHLADPKTSAMLPSIFRLETCKITFYYHIVRYHQTKSDNLTVSDTYLYLIDTHTVTQSYSE